MRKLLFIALLSPVFSMCQPLKGTVLNEGGEPVAGATITVHRSAETNRQSSFTTLHAISNNKGEFSLSGLQLQDTLIISAVGYKDAMERYDPYRPGQLTIMLIRKVSTLEGVTIYTGYQAIPKERATGSFDLVNNQLLNRQTGASVIDRLKGMVAGMDFNNGSLQPPLTIRGVSTILGSKAPLIIVDDFPYEGTITNINPADVETVTVLKDAAAASIWGTRAANGVIVITTKKARLNTPLRIELVAGSSYTAQPDLFYTQPISTADYIDLEQFLYNKGYYNSQLNNTGRPAVSPVVELLVKKAAGQLTAAETDAMLNNLKGLDVRNDFLRYGYNPALRGQYALTLRGGAPKQSFLLSAGYDHNRSALDATANRLNLRLQQTYQPISTLRFQLNAAYTQAGTGSGKSSYESFALANLYPYTRLADDAGNPLPVTRSYRQTYIDTAGGGRLLDWRYYPLDDYLHNRTATVLQDLYANLGLSYTWRRVLTLDLKYNIEQQTTDRENLQDLQSFFTRDMVNRFTQVNYTTGTVKYMVPRGDILNKAADKLSSQAFRAQSTFDKRWTGHTLTAIAGFEVRQTHITGNSYRLYGYNSNLTTYANVDYVNTYPTFINGAAATIPSGLSLSDQLYRFVSLYANVAWSLHDRYTITASARRDASNLFGVKTNDKWQPLWSAGAAWTLSKEPWYHLPGLPYLKTRITYGFNGNVDPSRAAVTTTAYQSFPASFTNLPQAFISQYENPTLKWERVATLNYGIDFETRNQRLTGTVEYYIKTGRDLLGNAPVDYTTGVGNRLVKNIAAMKGRGMDLTLNTKLSDGTVKASVLFTGSYHNSKVTRYYNTSTRGFDYLSNGNAITALEGKPAYAVLSFQWAGLDSLGNPRGIVNHAPTTTWSDITGNKTGITDLVYSGPALPTLFGSLQPTIAWKGLALTMALQYKLGYYFRRTSIDYGRLFSQALGHSDYALRWQKPGDEQYTSVPALLYPNNSNRDAFYTNAEVLVEKGDHLRMQFVNLSYDLPGRLVEKGSRNTLQVYVNASDLGILWKANNKGIDPDYGTTIPPSPTLTVGFKINL